MILCLYKIFYFIFLFVVYIYNINTETYIGLMNNWKPLIFYDTKTVNNGSKIGDVIGESNPGGDSIVMFLGITDFSI